MSRKRALVAAMFAVAYPGLGHVYLRAWWRALAWFGLALLTAAAAIPESAVAAFRAGDVAGFVAASRDLPFEAVAALLFVRAVNVLDAAWLGYRSGRARADPESTCPHCGRELDGDLDFCHWCTATLRDGEGS